MGSGGGTPAPDPGSLAAALAAAASADDVASVAAALARGADVNAAGAATGLSALHLAASRGHGGAAELLHLNGADVRALTPRGASALDLALANGHAAVAGALRSWAE